MLTSEIREKFHARFVQILIISLAWTRVKLLPNFTRQHLITHTNFPINDVGGRENTSKNFSPQSWV